MRFNSFRGLVNHMRSQAIPNYRRAMSTVMDELGSAVAKEAQAMVGHYPSDITWAPLAQSTIETKARKGLGLNGNPNSPLYATGAFQRDISHVVSKSQLSATIGTRKEYIIVHEFGNSKTPPRPVFSPAANRVIPNFLNRIKSKAVTGLTDFGVARFKR